MASIALKIGGREATNVYESGLYTRTASDQANTGYTIDRAIIAMSL